MGSGISLAYLSPSSLDVGLLARLSPPYIEQTRKKDRVSCVS